MWDRGGMKMAVSVSQQAEQVRPNGECVFSGKTKFTGVRDTSRDVPYCTSKGRKKGYLGADNWVIADGDYQLKIIPQEDCAGCPHYQPR